MNEKLNYNEIEVGQSSKGIWYCKSIRVTDSDTATAVMVVDDIIGLTEDVLKKYNEPGIPEMKVGKQ